MHDVLKQTHQCVMCGLCLPHCPTYTESREESESPRGRISLMRALNEQRLTDSPSLHRHLDNCLGCRACEAVCPARVPYGQLIDGAEALLSAQGRPGKRIAIRLSHPLFRSRRFRNAIFILLRIYQNSGLQALLRSVGVLRLLGLSRMERMIPRLPAVALGTLGRDDRRTNTSRPVHLFSGCVAELFDRDTLAASAALLGRLGFSVRVPQRQTCCGAVYQHTGFPEYARRQVTRNLQAFSDPAAAPLVSTATGCGAQLEEYTVMSADPDAGRLAARHADIHEFLIHQGALKRLTWRPLRARVAVHTPCSLRNVLKQESNVVTLLRRIPGLEVLELPGNARCCGAAGVHMLTRPAMADRLVAPKVTAIRELKADFVVTSNIGCRLHLVGALRGRGLATEVLHPVTLLERQSREA